MKYNFKHDGEVPAKKNSRVVLKNGKNIPSKNYQEWHKVAYASLFCQRIKQKIKKPVSSPVSLCIKFIHGDRRRRDSDNGLSSILDTLVDAGILEDDKWEIVRNVILENEYKENAPGVQITIIEL